MNPVIQNLYDRKSIRAYTDRPVSAEDKDILFEAAMQAPTGGSQQGFTIIDVTDQAIKDQLAELCDHQPFIATAPVVLVFIADSQKWHDAYKEAGITPDKPGLLGIVSGVSNTCIVAQNVVVAADALGMGSCYIGDILENCEKIRELFKLPQYCLPAAMLCIGYPTEQQKARKKPARFPREYMVCENQYKALSGAEIRDMFQERTASKGFDEYLKSMFDRKTNADFAKEMARSIQVYLDYFQK